MKVEVVVVVEVAHIWPEDVTGGDCRQVRSAQCECVVDDEVRCFFGRCNEGVDDGSGIVEGELSSGTMRGSKQAHGVEAQSIRQSMSDTRIADPRVAQEQGCKWKATE
eukprot:3304008-Amphidinium_carterae.1